MVTSTHKAFREIAKAYFLNEDFDTSERTGFWGSLVEGLAEATFWKDYATNTDFAQEVATAMQFRGLPLSKEQIDRTRQSIAEKVGAGIGASIPVMAEIMVTTLITQGIGTLPALARVGNAFYGVVSKIPRIGSRLATVIRSSITSTVAFGLAGQDASAGFGEGLVQGLIGGKLPLLKVLQQAQYKVIINGIINNLGIRYAAHIASETAQEYGGDLMSNLMKESSVKQALRLTFGKTADQAGEKLLVTALICAAFGKASAIKGLVADTTQNLEVKRNAAKSKETKAAYEKALALLNMVGHFQTEGATMAPVVPYQVQKAPEIPPKLENNPQLTLLHQKLKERKAKQNTLEEALGDLKKQVGIQVEYNNPSIIGTTVQVHYTPKTYGFGPFRFTAIETVRVRVGPDATVQNIKEHLATIRYMQSYRGLSGRMKVFGQQFLNAMGWHRTPGPGTALWEAKQEIEKLSRILISRANAIEQGRFDANKAGEIATELEMIQAQLAFYEGIANSVTKDSKGKGYVAMDWKKLFRIKVKKKIEEKTEEDNLKKTYGELEIPTEEEGVSIGSKIINDTIKEFPAFSFTADGCFVRADIVADRLMRHGIKTKKIFAVSTNEKGHGNLTTSSEYINEYGDKYNRWPYHVAAMFEVEKDGKIVQYVVDPPLAQTLGRPLLVEEWLKAISSSPLNKLENAVETLRNDFKKIEEGVETDFWYENQFGQAKMYPLTAYYFEANVNVVYDNLNEKAFLPFNQRLAKSLEDVKEYNYEAKIAKLATEIRDTEIPNLTQKQIDNIKQNYTREDIAFCIKKYGVSGLSAYGRHKLHEKMYKGYEQTLMRFAAKADEGEGMTINTYKDYIRKLKNIAGGNTKIYADFEKEFPNINAKLQAYFSEEIDRDFKQDLNNSNFP